jgi:hypothetical protein
VQACKAGNYSRHTFDTIVQYSVLPDLSLDSNADYFLQDSELGGSLRPPAPKIYLLSPHSARAQVSYLPRASATIRCSSFRLKTNEREGERRLEEKRGREKRRTGMEEENEPAVRC